MSSSAYVRSIETLDDLRGALNRFSGEAQEALTAAALEVARTEQWLQERWDYWQNEVRRREEARRQAEAALAHCRASGDFDREGHYHAPDCTAYEHALLQAQARLREAEAELRNVRRWIALVQQATADYQREASRLATLLANSVPTATGLLSRKTATLRSYIAVSPTPTSTAVDSSQPVSRAPLLSPEGQLSAAVQELNKLEGLQPADWQQMDIHLKVATLNTVGRALCEAFHVPRPPLLVQNTGDAQLLGSYGDGYRFDKDAGQVQGSDYRITLNTDAEIEYGKLVGDDPRAALRVYAHEFRHSYQAAQANIYQKPQFWKELGDRDSARLWADNFADYKPPNQGYEEYRNQPVEKDARDFAAKLLRMIYGR